MQPTDADIIYGFEQKALGSGGELIAMSVSILHE